MDGFVARSVHDQEGLTHHNANITGHIHEKPSICIHAATVLHCGREGTIVSCSLPPLTGIALFVDTVIFIVAISIR